MFHIMLFIIEKVGAKLSDQYLKSVRLIKE